MPDPINPINNIFFKHHKLYYILNNHNYLGA